MRLARSENASRRWASKLLERKPAKLAAVALANKTAGLPGSCWCGARAIRRPPCNQVSSSVENRSAG